MFLSNAQITGSEYCYCVDEITEDLKMPHFFHCILSPNCSSALTVLSRSSEFPIPCFLIVFPFQTGLDPSCPA